MSHIRISVRYSWSVQTWPGTVNVKMSVEGRCPLSSIQRPIRMCHQKSGSCSPAMKSERVTIITPPRSSVLALSRSVSRMNSAACLEGVGEVPGHTARVSRVVVREGPLQHALLPADAQELARDEIADRQRSRPARGGEVDPDRGHDLAEIHR